MSLLDPAYKACPNFLMGHETICLDLRDNTVGDFTHGPRRLREPCDARHYGTLTCHLSNDYLRFTYEPGAGDTEEHAVVELFGVACNPTDTRHIRPISMHAQGLALLERASRFRAKDPCVHTLFVGDATNRAFDLPPAAYRLYASDWIKTALDADPERWFLIPIYLPRILGQPDQLITLRLSKNGWHVRFLVLQQVATLSEDATRAG